MISALQWVKKGTAKSIPNRYTEESDDEEIPDNPNDPYDMENYDNDKREGKPEKVKKNKSGGKPDPYEVGRESVQDMEDFFIMGDDMILLAAVSEEDGLSHLDVYVYSSANDIFVHHDYLLPAFPLSLAWLDHPVGGKEISGDKLKTNMVAVGTFEPYIELWDLDTVDLPAPVALLGGPEDPEDIGNCGSPDVKLVPGSHNDSVLSLSWNVFQKNLIASASADKTAKLWDLNNGKCLKTYDYPDKVSCVLWNPVEPSVLANGCYGGTIGVTDVRSTTNAIQTKVKSDIESMSWLPAPHHNHVVIGTEEGKLICYDIVSGFSKPLWTVQAHQRATQSISVSPVITGLLATGSSDPSSTFKIWDITEGKPVCLYTGEDQTKEVYSVKFAEDDPFLLALGVKHKRPMFVDTKTIQEVYRKFNQYAKKS
jgi:periodic tryptophan protein 1